MAYLAVNRNGEELVFNDCPIYDRVEDTWKIPMLRWELVYDDPHDHSAGVHEDEVRDDNYWCATCGPHSHKKDSKTGYCWYCDTVNWVKEDRKDVGI